MYTVVLVDVAVANAANNQQYYDCNKLFGGGGISNIIIIHLGGLSGSKAPKCRYPSLVCLFCSTSQLEVQLSLRYIIMSQSAASIPAAAGQRRLTNHSGQIDTLVVLVFVGCV